jgi:hypothetical protein
MLLVVAPPVQPYVPEHPLAVSVTLASLWQMLGLEGVMVGGGVVVTFTVKLAVSLAQPIPIQVAL